MLRIDKKDGRSDGFLENNDERFGHVFRIITCRIAGTKGFL
jgi:hypothetical protein